LRLSSQRPICELPKRKQIFYGLTNLEAVLFYLGDDLGSGCVWIFLMNCVTPSRAFVRGDWISFGRERYRLRDLAVKTGLY
jgi:hypothetical protein